MKSELIRKNSNTKKNYKKPHKQTNKQNRLFGRKII